MINNILMGVFKLILSLVSLLLIPIDLAISTYLPDLDNALSSMSEFFLTFGYYIGWLLDALCIKPITVNLLVSVMIFKLTFPLIVNLIKTAIKWYDKLKV